MMKRIGKRLGIVWLISLGVQVSMLYSQKVTVGAGSYTTTFPGTDVAGRNGFPSGSPLVVDALKNKPIPSNDWWSAKLKSAHCDNLFNYPLTMKTVATGLVVSYIPWGVISDIQPIVVGVKDLNVSSALVSDYSDWTVAMEWKQVDHRFQVRSGMGMPMVYFQKDAADSAKITVNSGTVTVAGPNLIVENAYNGADFIVYAPSGSVWQKRGTSYFSGLGGKNYWSMLMLPHNTTQLKNAADSFQRYAFVEPVQTESSWSFNEKSSTVHTVFTTKVVVHEGTDSTALSGLLPHHWSHLTGVQPKFTGHSYTTVRGALKLIGSNRFEVELPFKGILPTLPYVDFYSKGFDPTALTQKIEELQYEGLSTWTDSYNEGQVMNRLIQTARVAHEMGNDEAVTAIVKTIKTRLEDWLSYASGEVAFLFYYNKTWTSMLGYPAGHGQDNNLNDHHFHWGYFIHAAAFMEEFEPGWSKQFGDMIGLLIRDAASPNRQDALFPYLRNFNPYGGHCWANGFATFPQGNDQESTSESMQFNSSLIHWGMVTGNTAIRDLGIYLYTTEQSAIEEYWFDTKQRNFQKTQPYALVSRVWGNSYDNGTFWTNDIAASYGIELYPIHGGSLYLAHDSSYVKRLWTEMAKNTGILSNQANDNLWHDVYWKYLAFIDPAKALQLYNSFPNRNLKFGISDAQTYHWLHALNALGRVNSSITSNHPLAAVFTKNGKQIYVGKNYSRDTLKVTFSDGYVLSIPPKKLVTSLDLMETVSIRTPFKQYYKQSSVPLRMDTMVTTPDSIVWYNNGKRISVSDGGEYGIVTAKLNAGKYQFYAVVYVLGKVKQSNVLTVYVGEQLPYENKWNPIPGKLESGRFDQFEGGAGQGFCYVDIGFENLGNARKLESVDVSADSKEGLILTWIEPGEWCEYSVDVAEDGLYTCVIRYSNGNSGAKGKLVIIQDGNEVGSKMQFSSTGKWENFSTTEILQIPLRKGKRRLRLSFVDGGMNISSLTFTKTAEWKLKLPVADAGGNKSISKFRDTLTVSAARSVPGALGYLQFQWIQLYGPTVLSMGNANSSALTVSGLQEGVYKLGLKVFDSVYSDISSCFIYVGDGGNLEPEISLVQPIFNQRYFENQRIPFAVSVADPDGRVARVVYWIGGDSISTSLPPFSLFRSLTAGKYWVFAEVTDDSNATVRSDTINFEVVSIAGDWKLLPQKASMAVGPDKNTLTWWSNSDADINTRSCLFDDVYRLEKSGQFFNVLGSQTWLEGWQNSGKEGCGLPKSPHDGQGTGTWYVDSLTSELVVVGTGSYLGLPKVTNQGELGNGATEPGMRRYQMELEQDVLVTGINFGTGYWQFKFVRASASNGVLPTERSAGWKLYPNPVTGDWVTLHITGASHSMGIIRNVAVVSPTGQCVYLGTSSHLDVTSIANGMYYVRIETDLNTQTQVLWINR